MPGHRQSGVAATIATAAFLWGTTVSAYSPASSRGHGVLSNFAIDLFNECVERGYGESGYRLNKNERALIVGANLNEDRTRPFRRIFNWHFYHPQQESKQRILFFINRSFIPLFSKIEARLERPDLSWNQALRSIGRAIHFIEDLTVPAHSVPVFHGAGLKDAFESFPLSGAPSARALEARINASKETICSRLSSQSDYAAGVNGLPGEPSGDKTLTLRNIVDRTRSFTIARLGDRICDEPGSLAVTWHYFWRPPEAKRYFGTYRENAEFGKVREITDSGLRCEITAAKYRNFSTGLHLQAVFADVRALYWFSARHSRR